MLALYLIGPPGVGKSTVLAHVVATRWVVADPIQLHRTLWAHRLLTTDGVVAGLLLGRVREAFSGTDALSMSVNPAAVEWAQRATLPPVVMGEGQRLATVGFLSALAARTPTTVVMLSASSKALDARCGARGSGQSETWRKGAATRALHLAHRLGSAGVRVVTVDAERPLGAVVAAVREVL